MDWAFVSIDSDDSYQEFVPKLLKSSHLLLGIFVRNIVPCIPVILLEINNIAELCRKDQILRWKMHAFHRTHHSDEIEQWHLPIERELLPLSFLLARGNVSMISYIGILLLRNEEIMREVKLMYMIDLVLLSWLRDSALYVVTPLSSKGNSISLVVPTH